MAISTAKRRRMTVDDQTYVWWVVDDEEACGKSVLTVASPDKQFLVKFQLVQAEARRHVVVLGRRFRSRTDCGGCWRRFRCPQFGTGDSVTPKDVAALVRWCNLDANGVIEVDWQGTDISSGASTA